MMNDFYEKVQKVSEANDDLSETAKAVVLMRAAIEGSAREVGIESTVYLVSKLMTATLGIMAGDEQASFENMLDTLDSDGMTTH